MMRAPAASMLVLPDLELFRTALSDMPAAVHVITARDTSGAPVGTTLSAVSSLSLDPPMMLACFDLGSNTLAALHPGAGFLIHLLAEGQEQLAYRMAGKGEKFTDLDWAPGFGALPQIAGVAAVFHCTVAERLPGGDHVIVTGDLRGLARQDLRPLVYHRRALFSMPSKEI